MAAITLYDEFTKTMWQSLNSTLGFISFDSITQHLENVAINQSLVYPGPQLVAQVRYPQSRANLTATFQKKINNYKSNKDHPHLPIPMIRSNQTNQSHSSPARSKQKQMFGFAEPKSHPIPLTRGQPPRRQQFTPTDKTSKVGTQKLKPVHQAASELPLQLQSQPGDNPATPTKASVQTTCGSSIITCEATKNHHGLAPARRPNEMALKFRGKISGRFRRHRSPASVHLPVGLRTQRPTKNGHFQNLKPDLGHAGLCRVTWIQIEAGTLQKTHALITLHFIFSNLKPRTPTLNRPWQNTQYP